MSREIERLLLKIAVFMFFEESVVGILVDLAVVLGGFALEGFTNLKSFFSEEVDILLFIKRNSSFYLFFFFFVQKF